MGPQGPKYGPKWVILGVHFGTPKMTPFWPKSTLEQGFWAQEGSKKGSKNGPKWVIFDPKKGHFGPYFGPKNHCFWPEPRLLTIKLERTQKRVKIHGSGQGAEKRGIFGPLVKLGPLLATGAHFPLPAREKGAPI